MIRIFLRYLLEKWHFTYKSETSFALSRTLRMIDSLHAAATTKLTLCVYAAFSQIALIRPWTPTC